MCVVSWLCTRSRCIGSDHPSVIFSNSRTRSRTTWETLSASRSLAERHQQQSRGRGWGRACWKVVESHEGNAYRAVYTVRFEKAVYVPQAFQKKSPSGIRTAKRDVDLVAERLKTAEKDYEEHYGKAKR